MNAITLPELTRKIEALLSGQSRSIVAIAGPPASGKSTLAESLADQFGGCAKVLPMDGFHLENDELRAKGLLHRKGAPETFDAPGFIALLRQVREGHAVRFPTFDRDADKTIPDADRIDPDTKIILVEGNYLLLKTQPWSALAGLFDLTIGLQVEREALQLRLINRWIEHGMAPEDAAKRALGNDMANVDFVNANSFLPMHTIATDTGAIGGKSEDQPKA